MASFTLFSDKPTLFECRLDLEGASLKETMARLVVETPDKTLMFKGKVSSEGVCSIPINKLRGLVEENATGKIHLEVIAEDTYFSPWSSDYVVTASKKLTVEVASPEVSSKPTLRVEVTNATRPTPQTKKVPALNKLTKEIVMSLIADGITASNALNHRNTIKECITDHMILSGIENVNPSTLVPQIINALPKR